MTTITNRYEKAVKWHYRLKNIILHFCRSYKFITTVQIEIRVFKSQSAFNEFFRLFINCSDTFSGIQVTIRLLILKLKSEKGRRKGCWRLVYVVIFFLCFFFKH